MHICREANLDDWELQRRKEKTQAVERIEYVFSTVEKKSHEPDEWERECLVDTISALSKGLYGLALSSAEKALTPASERNPDYFPREGAKYDDDLATLQQAFTSAKIEPVRLQRDFR